MNKITSIIWSWDTAVALAAAIGAFIFLPKDVPSGLLKDILSLGISVLTIIFSIYFASLTFIISSSDDEFVHFLHEGGHYNQLIWIFRYTLSVLLLALFSGLCMYLIVALEAAADKATQSSWFAIIFIFLFAYSLIASFLTTNDAIKYAERRAKFIDFKHTGGSTKGD